ncbi:MAG: hypothetical protein V1921_05475 [Candidatus Altiarchaeota archaeon]
MVRERIRGSKLTPPTLDSSELMPVRGGKDTTKSHKGLLLDFVGECSWHPEEKERLIAVLDDDALNSKDVPRFLDQANRTIGYYKKGIDYLTRQAGEEEIIDLDLMRLGFAHSLNGTLRDFKFYSDAEKKTLRPELQMMKSLLEKAHPGRSQDYVNNWIGGIDLTHNGLPYEPGVERHGELRWRYVTRLDAAASVLLDDTILDRLIKTDEIKEGHDSPPHNLRKEITECIYRTMKPEDSQKVKELAQREKQLSDKIKSDPSDDLLGQIREAEKLRTQITAKADNEREEKLKELRKSIIENYQSVLELPKDFSDNPEKKEEYAEYVTDRVITRVRNLNKMRRMMRDLKDCINESPDLTKEEELSRIKTDVSRIIQVEADSRKSIEGKLDVHNIAPAESRTILMEVRTKIGNMEDSRSKERKPGSYDNIRTHTSDDMFKWLEGLGASDECLSVGYLWHESHSCTPEMLFSATTTTLLLEGQQRGVEASLTGRLMPAIVEGKIEPVLFRQKMRAKTDDNHRYFLNDAFIKYAILSGATKIAAHSGTIGDPFSLKFNHNLFEKPFVVEYDGASGEKIRERVTLTTRQERKTTLKFIEPVGRASEGVLHTHEKKERYTKKETIEGVETGVFSYPDDLQPEKGRYKQNMWIVDISRERIQ